MVQQVEYSTLIDHEGVREYVTKPESCIQPFSHWYKIVTVCLLFTIYLIIESKENSFPAVIILSRETPIDGPLRDHYIPLVRGALGRKHGDSYPIICERCGMQWIVSENCTSPKAVDREGAGLGVFTQAQKVVVYCGFSVAGGSGIYGV